MPSALIIVDMQHDFLPGGALEVPDGDKIIDPIVKEAYSGLHSLIVTTQDWHPEHTPHFDKWPAHCVARTRGASLHPSIQSLRAIRILKGRGDSDGYSGFEGGAALWPDKLLDYVLGKHRIDRVLVCGVATEYCVKATALDALKLGYEVSVPPHLTLPVDGRAGEEALDQLEQAGARVYA